MLCICANEHVHGTKKGWGTTRQMKRSIPTQLVVAWDAALQMRWRLLRNHSKHPPSSDSRVMLPITVMPPPPTSRQRGTGQRNRASSTPRSSAAGAPSNRQSQLPGTYTDAQRGPSHPPVESKDPLQAIGEETVLAIQQGVRHPIPLPVEPL